MPDRNPCSSFVTESAWPTWGIPLLPTCPSVCFSEPFDRLRKPDGLSWQRSRFGFFQVPPREAESRLRAVVLWLLCPACGSGWRAVVVGHAQAMSSLIRRRFIGQGASHRSGCVPSALNGKERVFRSAISSFPIGVPSPTAAPFSLSRRREKVFALFFRLFLICRLLSFSFLPRAFLRAMVVSRKERGEKEKGESEGEEKTHKSFHDPRAKDRTGGHPL